jgi:hypothetical protein
MPVVDGYEFASRDDAAGYISARNMLRNVQASPSEAARDEMLVDAERAVGFAVQKALRTAAIKL